MEVDSTLSETPLKRPPGAEAPSLEATPEPGKATVPAPKPVEERDAKQKLVAQLLCRWWFALPPWPPEDFDSDAALMNRGFRRAPVNTFAQEPECDKRGLRKAYELEQFQGCFRTSDGELLDMRPTEGRPSYNQFMMKTTPELYRMLGAAYDAQLAELVVETKKDGASKDLEGHVEKLRKEASQVRKKATFYLMMTGKPKEEPTKNE